MSFLNLLKKKTEETKPAPIPARHLSVAPVKQEAQPPREPFLNGARDVIRRPRVTEKASSVSGMGVYGFEVLSDATKKEIREEIRALYKVVPVKIATVRIPAKKITVKGKAGVRKGGKKAYVYLKEGDKIEVM